MEDVKVWQVESVDVSLIRTDGRNPNRMTPAQREALAEGMRRFGFLVPIVCNRDYVVADGEQRLEVAKSLGMGKVPVVRIDVSEVDREMLRQVLNKLRGTHVPSLDAEEYARIVEGAGLQEFAALLGEDADHIRDFMEACKESVEEFLVLREAPGVKELDETVTIVFRPTREQSEKLKKKLGGRDIRNMYFTFVEGLVLP